MRLNKLLVVALAGMTMFSCSNDDEMGNGLSNGEKKTVVLKLDGIQSAKTRSTEEYTKDENTISLKDLTVVLYNDNGRIVYLDQIDSQGTVGSESKTGWDNFIQSNERYYVDVDASAKRVLVLGNVLHDKNFPTLAKGGEIKPVLEHEYLLRYENISTTTTTEGDNSTSTKNYVTLYGNKELTYSKIVDDNTHGDEGNKLYTASLTITPLISRFEVKSVGCIFENQGESDQSVQTMYQSITLKGIGLVDYYTKATVSTDGTPTATDAMHGVEDSKAEGTEKPEGIYSPLYNEAQYGNIPAGSYKFCGENVDAEWNWSFDKVVAGTYTTISNTIADGTTSTNFQNEDEEDLNFAYNFFPMHNAGDVYNTPNVRLYVDATGENGADPAKQFVVTTAMMQGNNPLKPVPGKIYQFDYIFREKNIGKWEEKISVEVTVKVADWIIEPVQPGFRD